jgi:hypothetical protein
VPLVSEAPQLSPSLKRRQRAIAMGFRSGVKCIRKGPPGLFAPQFQEDPMESKESDTLEEQVANALLNELLDSEISDDYITGEQDPMSVEEEKMQSKPELLDSEIPDDYINAEREADEDLVIPTTTSSSLSTCKTMNFLEEKEESKKEPSEERFAINEQLPVHPKLEEEQKLKKKKKTDKKKKKKIATVGESVKVTVEGEKTKSEEESKSEVSSSCLREKMKGQSQQINRNMEKSDTFSDEIIMNCYDHIPQIGPWTIGFTCFICFLRQTVGDHEKSLEIMRRENLIPSHLDRDIRKYKGERRRLRFEREGR